MAVVFRAGFLKGIAASGNTVLSASGVAVNQNRSISGKVMRQGLNLPPRPAPFPYKDKFYTLTSSWFDKTSVRFDDNSKLIIVEGPIAVGKTEFAKQLAEDLDMLHIPEANMDLHYINDYGFDNRTLDPQLPVGCRSFDHKNFCKDPNHILAGNFQIMTYCERFGQYIDALAHILNTGQGVILERSPYSDFVFVEAMRACNYMSKGARSVYYEAKQNTIKLLMRPHLVIYLDIPVNVVQQRVKQRNLPHEQNSKVFSTEFLTVMEKTYKQKYLKEIAQHSELLIYDWTGQGETEVIVEDIERIDFDNYEHYDIKTKDWRTESSEQDWADIRMKYTNLKPEIMNNLLIPRSDVPELLTSADDRHEETLVKENAPGQRYQSGYNKDMGDTGLLFKTTMKKYGEYLKN